MVVRCTGCGATHVLVQVLMLARRADTAVVLRRLRRGQTVRG